MTPEQYKLKIMKSPYAICRKYGHRKNQHLADSLLPAGAKSVEKSASNSNNDLAQSNKKSKGSECAQKKIVSFNCATLIK